MSEDVKQKETKKPEKKEARKKASRENKQVKTLKEKVAGLEAELEKAAQETATLKDQLLRKMAEFDNYKRRTEKEFIDNIQSASKELIEELLPAIDDFERSIDHAEKEETKTPLLEGVQLVHKNILNLLSKRGLKEIEAVGKEFNPDEHDALMQVDSAEHESGYIVDQHSKGYKLNDKVIRHSQVLVAK